MEQGTLIINHAGSDVEFVGDSNALADSVADLVVKVLSELGDTPDKVAATLARLGHRGDDSMSGSPVANYLRATLNPMEALVTGSDVTLVFSLDDAISVEGIELPDIVAEMQADFEDGEYPELWID